MATSSNRTLVAFTIRTAIEWLTQPKRQIETRAMTDALKRAVETYCATHASRDGLWTTPVPGLAMKCAHAPTAPSPAVYKPLVCFILQGAKEVVFGTRSRVIEPGKSLIVAMDLPITSHVLEARRDAPYLAVSVMLDMALVHELASVLDETPESANDNEALFVTDTDEAVLDCATRLARLIDDPGAIPLLQTSITRELHYWLLRGTHGSTVRNLAAPDAAGLRIGLALKTIQANLGAPLSTLELATAAHMSVSTFSRKFRAFTNMTPFHYQKHLRLVEARRMMMSDGATATLAATSVGYESVSHFNRDFARMFGAPPVTYVRDARVSPSRREGRTL
jgi:AraC-like DNA-binding protein